MFFNLDQVLTSVANHIPLPFFAFLASAIEETIPPIPSPSIMMISGFLASIKDYSVYGFVFVVIIGSLGKTFGAWFIYYIMDKIEDFLSTRFGKFIGLTHSDIESFGARLGHGKRDYFILTTLRAIPVFPSTILSVGGGLLKINLRLFLISTFIGSLFRNSLYIYLGYLGTTVANSFIKKTTSAESVIQILVVIFIAVFLGFMYYKRYKSRKTLLN
jgi:membrane protein DedA with SNARE-associated domain